MIKVRQSAGGSKKERDILAQIGHSTASGMVTVANVLDNIAARPVRGAIYSAMHPEDARWSELLSWMPRSDVGLPFIEPWTSRKNIVGGGDILGTKDIPGFQNRVLEFATEVALDPLTYVTLGGAALSKGGKALKAAGSLDDILGIAAKKVSKKVGPREARMVTNVQDVLDTLPDASRFSHLDPAEPIGGLARANIPFVGNVGTPLSGPVAQRFGKGLDVIGDKLLRTKPVRTGRFLFDPSAGSRMPYHDQMVQSLRHSKLAPAGHRAMRTSLEIRDQLFESTRLFEQEFGGLVPDVMNQTREETVMRAYDKILSLAAERGVTNLDEAMDIPIASLGGDITVNTSGKVPIENIFRGELGTGASPSGQLLASMQDVSAAIMDAKDVLYSSIRSKGGKAEWLNEYGLEHWMRFISKGAKDILEDIRTPRILPARFGSMLARQEALVGIPKEIVNKVVLDPGTYGMLGDAHVLTKYGSYFANDSAKAAKLTEWARQNGRTFLNRQAEFFNGTSINDLKIYMEGAEKTAAGLDAIHEMFYRNLGDKGMSIKDAFKKVGLTKQALPHWLSKYGDEAGQMLVSNEAVSAAAGLMAPRNMPQWAKEIGEFIDWATDMFKVNVTVPFPAFWARNHTSGLYVNVTSGEMNNLADLRNYKNSYAETWKILHRKTDDPAFAREYEIYVGSQHGMRDTDLAVRPSDGPIPESIFGGGIRKRAAEHRKELAKSSAEMGHDPPFMSRIPGGEPVAKAYQTVLETGGTASHNVEFMNRASMFHYLTRHKGWSPEMAGMKVKELQFDYGDMSDFERTAMKRMIPFYTFSRKAAPLTARTLMERPGGGVAQTLRAIRLAGGGDDPLPEHIGQTAAIKLGEPVDGTQRFLTGFGLPFEDVMGLARFHPTWFHTMQGTGQELMGRVTPYVKTPIEVISGTQFFTGRQLEDLTPNISRIAKNLGMKPAPATPIELEQLLAMSPAARYATTLRTITDPRKRDPWYTLPMQLGSGLRVTDTNLDQARGAAIAQFLEEKLRPNPNVRMMEHLWTADPAALPQEQQDWYEVYQSQQRESRSKSRARKKNASLQGLF